MSINRLFDLKSYDRRSTVLVLSILMISYILAFYPLMYAEAANAGSANFVAASNQYLSITDGFQSNLDITGDMTLETWIKPVNGSSDSDIISKFDGPGNQRSYLLSMTGSYNYLQLEISSDGSDGNKTAVSFPHTFPSGSWEHIAVVYHASSGSVDFYVNGVASGGTLSGMKTSIYSSSSEFKLGARNATPTGFFDGRLDDVRVWNIARSAADIAANYTHELAGTETGLVGYWKLNSNANDSSSSANDLANNNGVTYTNDVFVKKLKKIR